MPAPPDTALLSLSPLGPALPPLTEALPWAEALHEALVKLSDPGDARGPSPCILGRDPSGQPLTGHRHASVMPIALSGDGRLDHVLVHAPMAFDDRARAALAEMSRVWIAPGGATLRAELLALGLRGDLTGRVPALRASAAWASVTPFVPARHLKPRGRSALEDQVQAELASRGLPAAASVEVETEGGGYVPAGSFWELWKPGAPEDGGEKRSPAARWRRFRMARWEAEKRPPQRAGFGIRLRFADPSPGPIALGYASHFGLGQLAPV